jgi:hypothetical protein
MKKDNEWIILTIKELQEKMDLSLWTIHVYKTNFVSPYNKKTDPSGYSAEIKDIDHNYLDAKIYLSRKFYKKLKSRKDLCREILAHELAHIYTDETYEYAHDHIPKKDQDTFSLKNERLTQILTKFILK